MFQMFFVLLLVWTDCIVYSRDYEPFVVVVVVRILAYSFGSFVRRYYLRNKWNE